MRWRPLAIVLVGVAVYAGLAISSMRLKSAVFDEAAHLPAGYTYLRFHDFRLNPEHPPLVKMLAAAPLLLRDVHVRTDERSWVRRRQWDFGRRFLYEWNDGDRLLFLARLPIVALGALTAVAVFLWTRRHWGLPSAALAFFLCVLSPDMLAHGQVVTTDVGIALFVFLSVIAFERVTERASWKRLLLAGAAVGGAFATKFSAVVLGPILAVLAAVAVFAPEAMTSRLGRRGERVLTTRRARLRHVLAMFVAISLLAWAAVWLSYGFERRLSPDPEVEAAFDWDAVRPQGHLLAATADAVRSSRVLPEPYVYGFLRFFKHSEKRRAFLLGALSDEGWWYYFPVTFALKTPLGLVVLLALGGWAAVRRRLPWRLEAFLWLPVLICFATVMARRLNIGHRHLLPIYPFLFAVGGRTAALLWPQRADLRARRPGAIASAALVVGCLVWYAAAAARIHPHYLAYFNELAGGPENGYKRLVDSNLDWGQDLKGLKAWMDANGVPSVKLSYMGTAEPDYYGIACERLPGYPPPVKVVREVRPGDIVAVSATNLQGVYLDREDRGFARRLRRQEPLAMIGYSILVYRADFTWHGPE